ncbi:hypothetical protein [Xanthocytophaga agilis]|uniref:Uncharacterized protein n=1 Tax=Xanthocytophaga agilis TaxID=3048010 RepID=A0AAE3UDP3_9BACT|nr:hypothetical protein [Xanthocytophaga agilis]MDJ1500551.1 hypothetical protein [Xanthocytophaga agilis]
MNQPEYKAMIFFGEVVLHVHSLLHTIFCAGKTNSLIRGQIAC